MLYDGVMSHGYKTSIPFFLFLRLLMQKDVHSMCKIEMLYYCCIPLPIVKLQFTCMPVFLSVQVVDGGILGGKQNPPRRLSDITFTRRGIFEIRVILSIHHFNLIRLSLSPSGHLFQIFKNLDVYKNSQTRGHSDVDCLCALLELKHYN